MQTKNQMSGSSISSQKRAVDDVDPSITVDAPKKPRVMMTQAAAWDSMFEALSAFHAANGHCAVPQGHKLEDGRDLRCWVRNQRAAYRDSRLFPERQKKLESIGITFRPSKSGSDIAERGRKTNGAKAGALFITDDDGWNAMLEALIQYKKQHGTFSPPRDYVACGKKLFLWLTNQRQFYRNLGRGTTPVLTAERLQKLRAAGVPGFDEVNKNNAQTNEERWTVMFDELIAFHSKHGHFIVPKGVTCRDGRDLRFWASQQRQAYRNAKLSPERFEKLKSVGFDFTPKAPSCASGTGASESSKAADETAQLKRPASVESCMYYDREEQEYLERLEKVIALAEQCDRDVGAVDAIAASGVPNLALSKHSICKATKKVPKYLGSELFLSDEELRSQVQSLLESRGIGTDSLCASLLPVDHDPASLRLVVVGSEEVLRSFSDFFGLWCTARVRRFNYACLMKKGKRISVEIDSSKSTGAMISECINYCDPGATKDGILLEVIPNRQLASLIGNECTRRGACVVRLGGFPCLSIERFKEIMSAAGGGRVMLELSVEFGADLSAVPPSCLGQSIQTSSRTLPSNAEHVHDSVVARNDFLEVCRASVSPSPKLEIDKALVTGYTPPAPAAETGSLGALHSSDKGAAESCCSDQSELRKDSPKVQTLDGRWNSPTAVDARAEDTDDVQRFRRAIEKGSFLQVLKLLESGGLERLVDTSVLSGMLRDMKKVPRKQWSRDLQMKEMLVEVYHEAFLVIRTSKAINSELTSTTEWSVELGKRRRMARMQLEHVLALRNQFNGALTEEERGIAWLSINIRIDKFSIWRVARALLLKDLIEQLRSYETEDARMVRMQRSATRRDSSCQLGSIVKGAIARETGTVTITAGVLSSTWLTGAPQVCRHYAHGGRCPFRWRCRYWHVQKALGDSAFDSSTSLLAAATGEEFDKCLHVKTGQCESGQTWHTAGYRNETNRRVCYAQGGSATRSRDRVGVWWYRTKEEAVDALRRVVSVSAMRVDA